MRKHPFERPAVIVGLSALSLSAVIYFWLTNLGVVAPPRIDIARTYLSLAGTFWTYGWGLVLLYAGCWWGFWKVSPGSAPKKLTLAEPPLLAFRRFVLIFVLGPLHGVLLAFGWSWINHHGWIESKIGISVAFAITIFLPLAAIVYLSFDTTRIFPLSYLEWVRKAPRSAPLGISESVFLLTIRLLFCWLILLGYLALFLNHYDLA